MTGTASADVATGAATSEGLAARASGRPSSLALLGWLGFVLLLVYAVMVGGGYGGIQSVTMRVFSLSVIAVVLAGWGLVAWRLPAWRPGTAIWPALVIPLGSMALSTVLSPFPRLGIEYLAWAVLLVALYLLLVRILGLDFTRARIGGLAAILGGVIGLLYLAVVVGLWLEWWGLLGRLAVPPLRPELAGLPIGGPNLIASVVLLLTVIAFAGLGVTTRGRRAVLTLLAGIAVAVVLVSGSRSAWLAVIGALTLVGGLWIVTNHELIGRRMGDRRAWAVLGAVFGALVIGAIALGPIVLDRLLNAGDGGRPSYWASAVRMFEDAPVVGLGPGAWAARRIAYLEPGELDYTVPHAHDIYLQTLAELGLVGLAAGIVALAAVLWLITRALRSSDGRRRAWAWAALFGIVYLAIVNVVDFYANLPGVLVLLAIPVAMLDAASDRGLGLPARLRRATAERVANAALALGCVVSVVLLAWAESTALTGARATAAADASDWDAAMAAATDAVSVDPSQPGHQLTLALAAMHQGDWDTARAAFRESVAVDDLPQGWLGLALATLESGGSAGEVADYLDAAMRVGSQHAAIAYGAAEIYDQLGMTDEADEAYTEALVRLPALASDPAWRSDPALARRFDALLEAAIARSGPSGWQVALMAGDAGRAMAAARGSSDETEPVESLVAGVIEAWDGDIDALAGLQARADADPMDAGLLTTAALLTARARDGEKAARYRRLALTTTEGPSILGLEVHTAATCEDEVGVPVAAQLHGMFAYRRPTPRNLMPPGLRCLVLHDHVGRRGTDGDDDTGSG